ncbi:MAG TPA: ATP-binding protein, partial [Thermodesulfobacteriota bacterium]|nr:ATP-binding protein [Thermodesulfobacteriota bacterium]
LDYITDLTRNLLRVYKELGEDVDVQINAYDISIDIDRAIPCGLIINELFSNCLKHAFGRSGNGKSSSRRRNKITVEINSDSEGILVLTVRDNGAGFPVHLDLRSTETLGLQLVTTLADQLRGTIDLARDDGTAITIVFPLSANKPDGSG